MALTLPFRRPVEAPLVRPAAVAASSDPSAVTPATLTSIYARIDEDLADL